MNWVKYNEYNDIKTKFFNKHNHDYKKIESGTSAEYYRKTYAFKDGAVWYEVMTKEEVPAEAEAYGIKVPVLCELLRTEFWSSENADSCFYFEPWDTYYGTH